MKDVSAHAAAIQARSKERRAVHLENCVKTYNSARTRHLAAERELEAAEEALLGAKERALKARELLSAAQQALLDAHWRERISE
jgi:hypothetical protein